MHKKFCSDCYQSFIMYQTVLTARLFEVLRLEMSQMKEKKTE